MATTEFNRAIDLQIRIAQMAALENIHTLQIWNKSDVSWWDVGLTLGSLVQNQIW